MCTLKKDRVRGGGGEEDLEIEVHAMWKPITGCVRTPKQVKKRAHKKRNKRHIDILAY